jgi:signal transduction histidine kinase
MPLTEMREHAHGGSVFFRAGFSVDRSFLKRLVLGHASIVVVIVLCTTTALLTLRSTIRQAERTIEIDQRLELFSHLRSDARELARSARRYLLTGDPKEQQRVFAIEREMKPVRERLGIQARRLEPRLADYIATVSRSMAADRAEPSAALAGFEDVLIQVRGPLSATFDQLIAREQASREASPSSQRLAHGAQWALLAAAALGMLLTVGGLLAVIRELQRQAARTHAAETVAERTSRSREGLLAAGNELHAPLERIETEVTRLYERSHDEQQESLKAIASAAAQLNGLLRRLLDVTAVQAGTVSLRREACDVAMLVDKTIKDYRERARERGVRLRFEVQLSMSVSVDRERIAQALTTLVGLAIESSSNGDEIVLGAAPCDDGVRFAITGSDIAVSPSEISRPAAAASPSDLALHLTQRVIEAHGGRLGVQTAAAGRTYWFTVPTEPRLLR